MIAVSALIYVPLTLLGGVVVGVVGCLIAERFVWRARRDAALRDAEKIIDEARRKGEETVKAASLDAKEEYLARQEAFERESNETRNELRQTERSASLAEEQAKLAILEGYLPSLLSREQVVEEARRVIVQLGATGMGQMGQVMRSLMSELKGRADGRVVNEVVRELLSG